VRSASRMIAAGAMLGGLAVLLGAFAAHALRGQLEPRDLDVFQTAVSYQQWHAVALVLTGLIATRFDDARSAQRLQLVGWLFAAGIALFCGSLYALVFTGIRALGIITPFGGLCFVAAWLALGWASLRLPPSPPTPD
jgi:uncharacterized membrane protein YgdD (TMEM256/DUF423 family)